MADLPPEKQQNLEVILASLHRMALKSSRLRDRSARPCTTPCARASRRCSRSQP
jgi:hypothetical protein